MRSIASHHDRDHCPACGAGALWPDPPTHPEDVMNEAYARVQGKLMAGFFAEKYGERLVKLIATYPDFEAVALLMELRDEFWESEEWMLPGDSP